MPIAHELTLAGILPLLARDAAAWSPPSGNAPLRSVFQPVLSISHKRIVGYEALLRATDTAGAPVTAHELFTQAQTAGDASARDKLTRCVHIANFAEQRVDTGWLFLNALPQLFQTGWQHHSSVDELCAHFALPPARIVIEVLEQPAEDESLLSSTMELRSRDFLIAIDDFGTGFSNFDRVWQFRPDIVKLDRSLVARLAKPGADHQFMS